MTYEWSESRVLRLLELIKGSPSLWNPKDNEKNNKNKKKRIYRDISAELDTSPDEVRRKLANLLQSYRSYRRKVKKSVASGRKDAYKPNWFAYEPLHQFMEDVYTPLEIEDTTIDHSAAQVIKHNEVNSESEDVNIEETDEITTQEDSIQQQKSQEKSVDKTRPFPQQKKTSKRKRHSNNKQDPRIVEYLLRKESELARRERDECDLYGELVTMKLKKMDEVTRQYVMNNVDNLMFQAVIHNRHTPRSSTVSPPLISPALSFSSQPSPSYSYSSKSSPSYSHSQPSTSFDRATGWGLQSSKGRTGESPELDHRPIAIKEECE